MKKAAKLAIVLLLVAVGGALAFVGAAPAGYKGVAEVASSPSDFLGREVLVKATVAEGSVNKTASPLTFVLAEPGARLPVVWSSEKAVPEHEAGGTIEGRTVVVKGTLESRDGRLVLVAKDMQVGCASKYEPANATASPA